jgi:hypothetical protein
MDTKFGVIISSDLNYENLIAEIYYFATPEDRQFVACLTQEEGFEKLKIEIYPPPKGSEHWLFAFDDFIKALNYAKDYLAGKAE